MDTKAQIIEVEKEVIEECKQNAKPSTKFTLEEKTLKELEGVANLIKEGKAKNIIILTGAGISTSSGIPDFRSPKTGLYHNLKKYNLPMAEDIFCIEYFEENPEPFFQLVKELYPGKFYPSLSHYFIRLVQEKGLLVRNFTQNIDGLERLAGLDPEYLIESHGAFHTSSCIKCRNQVDTDKVKNEIFNDKIPKCSECDGLVKPDIVFFGESMPEVFYKSILTDFPKCDLLIIMGTSLKVQPFASLVSEVRYNVPKLLINLENSFATPSPFLSLRKETRKSNQNRHYCESNCDDGVYALCELLGWREELMKMYNDHIDKMELFEFKGDEKSSNDDDDDAKLEKAMKELKVED